MSDFTRRHWKRRDSGSTAFLNAVTEQSYDSVIVVDTSGRIRYLSPSTRHMLGYGDGEVLGCHVLEFPHPRDRDRVRRAFASVRRTPGGTRTVEVRLRRLDGQYVWAQARLTNMIDQPAVRGIVVNTVLIDDRKTLELKHAAAKLEPHFLYNVLHSIAAMVRDGDGAGAVEALARVRNLTEGSMGSAEDRDVPLREEWDWIADYLALEQLRFGSMLQVRIEELPPALEDVMVPCRLVQPLVENAMKHGLRRRPDGGVFRLRAERAGSEIRIHVAEEGRPPVGDAGSAEVHGFRIGLRTLRERLNLYFGDDATVSLHVEPTHSRAVLRFPAEQTRPLAKQA